MVSSHTTVCETLKGVNCFRCVVNLSTGLCKHLGLQIENFPYKYVEIEMKPPLLPDSNSLRSTWNLIEPLMSVPIKLLCDETMKVIQVILLG